MKSSIVAPVEIKEGSDGYMHLVDADGGWIFRTEDTAREKLNEFVSALNSKQLAILFFEELLASVETLAEIADQHGSRTLSDLMYLHYAILDEGFIDHYPDESNVWNLAAGLPSGESWIKYIASAE